MLNDEAQQGDPSMYAEVLEEERILRKLDDLRRLVDGHLQESRGTATSFGQAITEEELQLVRTELDEARLDVAESGALEDAAVHATSAFIPRNATVSLLQSVLEQWVDERAADRGIEPVARETEELGVLPPVTNTHVPAPEGLQTEEEFDPFPMDARWPVELVAAMVSRRLHGKHPFNPVPAKAPLGQHARLCLFSDWGTGIPRARAVSGEIADRFADNEGKDRDRHAIHLGDVYYVGWGREMKKRILAEGAWPVHPSAADSISSWALNANHDMYSGGHGYYKVLLRDPRFARQQSADGRATSLFELENDDWIVLGLDTGWDEKDLVHPQVEWIRGRLANAQETGRSVLLLSHHQLFSGFSSEPEKIPRKLESVLTEFPVRVWFWGHEHRCTLYHPTDQVEHARCIGNGGVPAFVTGPDAQRQPELIEYDYEDRFESDDGYSWMKFAFAMLDFDGPKLRARYIDEDGFEFRDEPL